MADKKLPEQPRGTLELTRLPDGGEFDPSKGIKIGTYEAWVDEVRRLKIRFGAMRENGVNPTAGQALRYNQLVERIAEHQVKKAEAEVDAALERAAAKAEPLTTATHEELDAFARFRRRTIPH